MSGRRVALKNDCYPFLDSKLGPFDDFPKHACTHHYSVTVRDILMQFLGNTYTVRMTCRTQE